ncbi:phosphoribosyltransferase [candidate division KSB1 bacterium]|nr:phosphoribosyltransferase [candidate division KSB1 bacterium]NIR68503.1 phosphoribosyltransferase [candidate division KSB1 bacterium]NIS22517.1 phosphoribosyltransferase [candidate division KSB1 bacterium]NIT69361.1 phosphoribosyltransferase [candidate division KSB1 bacterium]NIU23022.1 phosphoribosyltransferase [candidate division KSB1 bacterium]
MALFKNRHEAGRHLAKKLSAYADSEKTIVLGLPRGGVPVAFEVAKALNAPLDVFVVRKLGVPDNEELAMGAIASGGVQVMNQEVLQHFDLDEEEIDDVSRAEEEKLGHYERLYRGEQGGPNVKNRMAILVDDGLATGASMRAAVAALKQLDPRQIIVAVPVAAPATCEEMKEEVDDIICAVTPEPFQGVGVWYTDFTQTGDPEVQELLERAEKEIDESVLN